MAATSALGSSPGSGGGVLVPEGSGEPVVVAPHDNRSKTNAGEVGVAQPVNMSVVTAKIGQELVTSLHLIKDIRRLEKYQRDFFLKVKESLSHVQVLLDHQLMDMAWSDNLIDCEENLLKVSNVLQQSPNSVATSQQMAELYGILIHDRDKLNHRFQELSIKSSLSEFVVNSRQLLDINAVRIAADLILKNEKPIPAQGDHSIPIDHTFFLGNFCTASLASSSMASILPGGPRQPSGGSGSGGGSTYPTNNARYENKKVNGTSGGQPAQQQQQQVRPSAGQQPPAGGVQPAGGGQQPQEMNGIGISNVLNSAAGAPVVGGNPVDFGGIYSNAGPGGDQAGLDKYLGGNSGGGAPPGVGGGGANAGNATGPPGGNGGQGGNNGGRVVQAGSDMTNGMYGQHELVAAISQITADQTVVASNATGVVQHQQAKAVYNKTKKTWQDQNAGSGGGGSGPGGPTGGKQDYEAASNTGPPRGYGRGPQNSGGGSRSSNPRYSGGGGGGGNNGPPPDLSVANDGASDSLSSTSEEVVSSNAAIAGELGDNGKPLSFARIASLNLEKQAVHRPRKPLQIVAPTSENSASVTPTGGGGAVDSQGNFVSMGQTAPGMMVSAAQMQQQQQPNPNSNPGLAAAASMASMSVAEAVAAAHQQAASMHHGGGGGGPYPNQHAMAQQMAAMAAAAQMPAAIIQLPPTNNPRFFFDIAMDGKRLGRAIIEVQASLAPKMAQNFHLLASHEKGFGYRGCHFFQAWRNESVICGDWEHNSGRGGRAALDDGPLFTPDETKLPCIRGAVGMRRMSKKHSSLNQVASQFRVILANMNTQFTGIFGHVVSGIEALDKVADIGGDGGRPEKIASVTHCGIYKG